MAIAQIICPDVNHNQLPVTQLSKEDIQNVIPFSLENNFTKQIKIPAIVPVTNSNLPDHADMHVLLTVMYHTFPCIIPFLSTSCMDILRYYAAILTQKLEIICLSNI